MGKSMTLEEILQLPVEERLRLVEAVWDSLAATPDAIPMSETVRAEIERRDADDERNPEDVIPWADVKALLRRDAGGV